MVADQVLICKADISKSMWLFSSKSFFKPSRDWPTYEEKWKAKYNAVVSVR